jgi:hypothetical protein
MKNQRTNEKPGGSDGKPRSGGDIHVSVSPRLSVSHRVWQNMDNPSAIKSDFHLRSLKNLIDLLRGNRDIFAKSC